MVGRGVTHARGPGWLTSERVVLYGGLIVSLYAAILFAGILLAEGGPARVDFVAFQAAGRLAMAGEAAAAYDDERLQQVQAAILGVPREALVGDLLWLNPPHFFFAVLPSALLPYASGWALWIVLSVAALAVGVRAVLPGLPPLVAVLCLPAVALSLSVGQTGLLIAALLAMTLGLMDRRPVLAGIALGLLTIKPQFGLLFPLVLVLTGRWRVIGAAAATALLAGAASVLAFGPEPWPAFLAQIDQGSGRLLTSRSASLPRIQSVHAFLVHATGRPELAAAVHGTLALGVAAVVLRLWLRRSEAPEEARAAALLAGAFLITPYVWTYDLPALGIAALFLVRAGLRDGFLAWEQPLLLAAVLLPVATLVKPVSLLGPAAWLLVLALAWRRASAFSPAPPATAS